MLERPSYEDLEQEVRRLHRELSKKESDLREIEKLASIGNWEWNIEQQVLIWSEQYITSRKQMEETLKDSESKYRAIFDNCLEAIFLTAQDGSVFAANQAACQMLEMSEAKIISGGRNAVVNLNDPRLQAALEERKKTGKFRGELTYKKKDGTIFPVELSSVVFKNNHGDEVTCIFTHNITEQKQNEEELTSYRNYLAELVEQRTFELEQENTKCRLIGKLLKKANEELEQKSVALEEINTALKVLLNKQERDTQEMEENFFCNYEKMILPFLSKLKNSYSNTNQQNLINILETNLKEIISPFSKKLSDPIINLTPTEIQIGAFIKQGFSNKEIALSLNCSVRTIDAHRDNIRKKLNLKNKKINLRSFLINL
ncbi:MAG: PAS domain S-box protein [Desulfamplus sp.]|nr:PAS domain S-box protein [Desulfamplus sp.]